MAKLKFYKFTEVDGDTIFVPIKKIILIEKSSNGYIRVYLKGDKGCYIKETMEDVEKMLRSYNHYYETPEMAAETSSNNISNKYIMYYYKVYSDWCNEASITPRMDALDFISEIKTYEDWVALQIETKMVENNIFH